MSIPSTVITELTNLHTEIDGSIATSFSTEAATENARISLNDVRPIRPELLKLIAKLISEIKQSNGNQLDIINDLSFLESKLFTSATVNDIKNKNDIEDEKIIIKVLKILKDLKPYMKPDLHLSLFYIYYDAHDLYMIPKHNQIVYQMLTNFFMIDIRLGYSAERYAEYIRSQLDCVRQLPPGLGILKLDLINILLAALMNTFINTTDQLIVNMLKEPILIVKHLSLPEPYEQSTSNLKTVTDIHAKSPSKSNRILVKKSFDEQFGLPFMSSDIHDNLPSNSSVKSVEKPNRILVEKSSNGSDEQVSSQFTPIGLNMSTDIHTNLPSDSSVKSVKTSSARPEKQSNRQSILANLGLLSNANLPSDSSVKSVETSSTRPEKQSILANSGLSSIANSSKGGRKSRKPRKSRKSRKSRKPRKSRKSRK